MAAATSRKRPWWSFAGLADTSGTEGVPDTSPDTFSGVSGKASQPVAPEEWRPVPGYGGHFDASTAGRVRNSRTKRVVGSPGRHGYVLVGVYLAPGKTTTVGAHALVALAFHGRCPDGQEVDHENRVRWDNRPTNLRYRLKGDNAVPVSPAGDPARWQAEAEAAVPHRRTVCSACGCRGHNRRTCPNLGLEAAAGAAASSS